MVEVLAFRILTGARGMFTVRVPLAGTIIRVVVLLYPPLKLAMCRHRAIPGPHTDPRHLLVALKLPVVVLRLIAALH